jgi:hypothetical protein
VVLAGGSDVVDAFGEIVGDGGEVAYRGGVLLPVLVDDLHEGAEADGDEEGDDQGRHGAAERGLRNQ